MSITRLHGTLVIEHKKGNIFFQLNNPQSISKRGTTFPLWITGLPKEIPQLVGGRSLDITISSLNILDDLRNGAHKGCQAQFNWNETDEQTPDDSGTNAQSAGHDENNRRTD